MVRLTSWADDLMDGLARKTGIPREHLAVQIGGELEATLLEQISEVFTKGIGKILVDTTAGVIATGYAAYGKNVPERLRRELFTIGTHLLMRILEIIKMPETKASIESFTNSLKTGGLAGAIMSIFATPEEALTKIGLVTAPAPATQAVGKAVAVTVTPAAPAPAPTPVTGGKVY